MNFFVAGINLVFGFGEITLADRVNSVISTLSKINEDARAMLGEDAAIIVVLQEYALTPKAVSNADKKNAIAVLHEAVKQYPNLMLIPGTLASEEIFKTDDRLNNKTKKMLANYRSLSSGNIVDPKVFVNYMKNVAEKLTKHTLRESNFLQNSAYILTTLEKFKHKKCAPYHELTFSTIGSDDSVFYIGANDFIKNAHVNGKLVDTAILICLEHAEVKDESFELDTRAPLLHVVVSDFINLRKNKLYGALNIQMDSQGGLTVLKNERHYRANEIESVTARIYATTRNNSTWMPAQVETISTRIGPVANTTQVQRAAERLTDKIKRHKRNHAAAASKKRERSSDAEDVIGDYRELKRR